MKLLFLIKKDKMFGGLVTRKTSRRYQMKRSSLAPQRAHSEKSTLKEK